MAVRFGDSIVTKGLVLYLNAASQKNYVLSEVEAFVVAGGGAGGNGTGTGYESGGGGAGGLIYSSSYSITPGSAITVTVGDGGASRTSTSSGANGGNSVFGALTAIGGGGGASSPAGGSSGGSGGGGSHNQTGGGSGTGGQGFSGATPAQGSSGGGGGGAGGPGKSTSGNADGSGGIGLPFSISGSLQYYAGGGGGSRHTNVSGGLGGGGAGVDLSGYANGSSALPNTGGGGGGANQPATNTGGGSGGSGIVIVRYQGPQKATGGNTITQVGGFTIHTFTSSGTFTPLATPVNSGAVYGLQDLSGNGIIVNQSGGVTYSSANRGSLSFDGTNDVVNANTTLIDRSNGQEITVSCWIRPSRTSGQYSVFCTNRSNDTSLYNWIFYQHINDGAIAFHGIAQNKSTYIPTINVWINVTNTVTASGVSTLYVNGISTYVANGFTYGNSTSIGRLGIGADPGGQEPFQGNIAQVSIYDRALTASEITQNFNAQRGRFGI